MKWNEAIKLLDECEQGLRKQVAAAASEGDYASVQRIADLAKAVAALAAEGRSVPESAAMGHPGIATAASVPKLGNVNHAQQVSATMAGGRKTRSAANAYPKFFRRGDELVRVGWSKKERKEYNHRAPRTVVDATASAIRQVGARGKLFNGDALLPLKNLNDGSTVPDYQAYVALGWLKELGAVEQHGRRGGYTLVPSKQIDSAVTTAWPELAEWRG
jgi:hypothetical protein